MEFIHEFWVEMFPMFVEYEFIYVFFDVCTVLTLLTFNRLTFFVIIYRKLIEKIIYFCWLIQYFLKVYFLIDFQSV